MNNMAGYNLPVGDLRVHFGFGGKYNQGWDLAIALKTRTAKGTAGVTVSRRKSMKVALGLPVGSVISISYST